MPSSINLPFFRTTILSAFLIVERRWAMVIVVLFLETYKEQLTPTMAGHLRWC